MNQSTGTGVACAEVAERVLRRHLAACTLAHYAGILTLHGAVRLAQAKRSEALLREAEALIGPFLRGEVKRVSGAYDRMYRCGGNASAWLAFSGKPSASALEVLVRHADELVGSHPRDAAGVFAKPGKPDAIWIDTAFGVCPFLLWVGLRAQRPDFVDESCRQMLGMAEALGNPATGLYHQARGFTAPGRRSEDHWSRGNGWAALALAELAADLPDRHPRSEEVLDHYRTLMDGCLRVQDGDGLWHQEMTRQDSYVEISGTGLILYAIGRGLERGLLSAEHREAFRRGLQGCLGYVAMDGSVFNTCVGCLHPGDGSVAAYTAHPWARNDVHAFGPLVLAFGQAVALGVTSLDLPGA